MTDPRRIAYIVSRFPATSETFVVRELNGIAETGRFDVSLMSLFPATDDAIHSDAIAWVAGLERPSATQALAATGFWLLRRPLRLLGAIGRVLAATASDRRLLWRSLVTITVAAAHARSIERRQIEHVHAHFAAYPTLAAWLCKRLTGVRYSFTAHAYDIFTSQRLLATKIAEAQFVVTISDFNRRFLNAYGGEATTPVHVVHMGVDPARYNFRPRSIPADGPVRTLCVASLQEKKGHAVLLEALVRDAALDRVQLDLVGGGDLRGELERQVRALRLGGRVCFHGPCSEAEIRRRLAETDLFVLPSIVASDGQMEGLPVALIEALACGVPAVASRMSGIPELITDGETGVLADPGDPSSLAAALKRVIDGEQLDLAAGRRLVEQEFDVRASAARMAGLLDSARRS